MLTTSLDAARTVAVREVPEPVVERPTDAVVRVTATCICGSDLHPYRGAGVALPMLMGHEFLGVVTDAGSAVRTVSPGDLVVPHFAVVDGTCDSCRRDVPGSCARLSFYGQPDAEGVPTVGAQSQVVRVPLADGTLLRVGDRPGDVTDADLLALSDVMATGHHAAVTSGVGPGSTVVVVGDGAVGLSAVLAARRLGAERGRDGVAAVRELLGRDGADAVCECVGSQDAVDTAVAVTRPGGAVGFVGAPQAVLPFRRLFMRNVRAGGGVAPVRAYLPDLLDAVLTGGLRPGRVFDRELPLTDAAEGYRAMDAREAVKVLLRP
ncbi:alcohol dehydrogenase catalytic domain-containing protein [Blastococcus sp. TF02A-26]|uniref:alcohol dehydrogenase catalytic domain-containing protein n=1 Tax=Blastococcus sp. TF02A-26 TaxID=2250577 RepID=UPI000DEA4AE0|nr:alcohol dehydrogenase catalytic domain-containing protein [Blastococcus sp. TF02A-26]RBY85096.1 IMP dehydrogenase [Blastococcus sp. TF02A-26]